MTTHAGSELDAITNDFSDKQEPTPSRGDIVNKEWFLANDWTVASSSLHIVIWKKNSQYIAWMKETNEVVGQYS